MYQSECIKAVVPPACPPLPVIFQPNQGDSHKILVTEQNIESWWNWSKMTHTHPLTHPNSISFSLVNFMEPIEERP